MSRTHRSAAEGRTPRVLVLNQFALPRSQGGGTRHVELFGALPAWSHLILAGGRNYSTQAAYSRREPGFLTVPVPPSDGGPARRLRSWGTYVARATRRGLGLGAIDVVYASTPHLLTPVAGALIAWRRRVPLVIEVRDLWPQSVADASVIDRNGRAYRLLEGLERWVYARADAIVALTPGWEAHFERCGVSGSKVAVVTNGADVASFDVAEPREELRRAWGIRGFTAVFSGTHGPKDGIDYILDAARTSPQIQFLLVGTGPAKHSAQNRVRRDGLRNVTFADPVPKHELPRLLQACDVGIHAVTPLPVFEHGMSPNKLFDYLAAGLPVVSNAQWALRHVLDQGECGVLGGPDSLAAALEKVHRASPAERALWGERGRQIVAQRYARHVQAQHLADVLDSVTGRAQHARERVRVAHVSSAHPCTDNRVHLREAATLTRAGFDVALVAVRSEVEVPATGVEVHTLPQRSRLARVLINGPQAVWTAARLRPDVVHLHDPELCWAVPIFRALGTKVVYDAHEDLPKQVLEKSYLRPRARQVAALAARGVQRVARGSHLVVAATEAIGDSFAGHRRVVVHNYPRIDASEPADTRPPAIADGRPVLVYVGAMTKERGVREMVRACAAPDFPDRGELHLYGPIRPAALRHELTQLSGWERVVDHGVVSPDTAREAIREAHLGLVVFGESPAHVQSLPTKMFEYLAEGRPVIASDFPLWREIVDGLDCGVVVDPRDPGAIARAVRDYVRDPALYARHSTNARRAAHDRLNWAHEEGVLIAAYDDLMGTSGPVMASR